MLRTINSEQLKPAISQANSRPTVKSSLTAAEFLRRSLVFVGSELKSHRLGNAGKINWDSRISLGLFWSIWTLGYPYFIWASRSIPASSLDDVCPETESSNIIGDGIRSTQSRAVLIRKTWWDTHGVKLFSPVQLYQLFLHPLDPPADKNGTQ